MNLPHTQTYIILSKGKTAFQSQDVDFIKVKAYPITSDNTPIYTILFPYSSLKVDIREKELIKINPSDLYRNSQGYFIPLQKNSIFKSYNHGIKLEEINLDKNETTVEANPIEIFRLYNLKSPSKLPSQTYLIKEIIETSINAEKVRLCRIEPFTTDTKEPIQSYCLLFKQQCEEVNIKTDEIIEISRKHFRWHAPGYFEPNKYFKKCISKDINSSTMPKDTVMHLGQTIYNKRYVHFLKIKKYLLENNHPQIKEIIVLFPHDKKLPYSIVNSIINLDINHLKRIKGDLFIADTTFYACLHSNTTQISQEKINDKEKNNKPHLNIPSNATYTLPWDNVVFQNGNIVLRSPYASSGGLGKIVKWEECKADFEKIKIAIARIVQEFSVKIEYGNIVEVHNIEEIKKHIINLSVKPTKHTSDIVIKKRERIKVNPKATIISIERVRNLPETKSSQYLKHLCRLHIEKFPVYYCTETKQTNSGNASPEKAFIFFLKETNSKITIIYENTIESRSSYVFIANKQNYLSVINRIHQFFSSDKENKREKMAHQEVLFPKNSVFAYYRIIHNSFHQWKVEINSLT